MGMPMGMGRAKNQIKLHPETLGGGGVGGRPKTIWPCRSRRRQR